MSETYFTAVRIVDIPKPKWRLTICGPNGVVMEVVTAPCRFHRFIQRLILGFKWERI